MFDRKRGVAGSLVVAFLVGAAAIPSDSFGANMTFAPLVAPQELKTSGEPVIIVPESIEAALHDFSDLPFFAASTRGRAQCVRKQLRLLM